MTAVVLGPVLSLAGIVAAHRGWQGRSRIYSVAACALWAVSTTVWIWGYGPEIGTALALESAALLAFGFILTRIERREPREAKARARIAQAPAQAFGYRLRGLVRGLVAGPLGLIAALGVGVAVALCAPMVEQTRLILAGLIVPSLWAAFIVWTLSVQRPGRTAVWLAGAGGLGFAIAFAPQL
ncbi:MAG: hypothetical protein DI547_16215 [Sphingobium sp.]|jgi:hypothetical protein|nr:MAG: hypothetical protein DI547_16215 [Sphingobium sp.]